MLGLNLFLPLDKEPSTAHHLGAVNPALFRSNLEDHFLPFHPASRKVCPLLGLGLDFDARPTLGVLEGPQQQLACHTPGVSGFEGLLPFSDLWLRCLWPTRHLNVESFLSESYLLLRFHLEDKFFHHPRNFHVVEVLLEALAPRLNPKS